MVESTSSDRSTSIADLVRRSDAAKAVAAAILGRLHIIEGRFLTGTEKGCYVAGVNMHDLRRELEAGLKSVD